MNARKKKTDSSVNGSVMGLCVLPLRVENLNLITKTAFLKVCEDYYEAHTGVTFKKFVNEHSRIKEEFKKDTGINFLPENISVGFLGIVATYYGYERISYVPEVYLSDALQLLETFYTKTAPLFRSIKIRRSGRSGSGYIVERCGVSRLATLSREYAVEIGLDEQYGSCVCKVVTSIVQHNILKEYPYVECMNTIKNCLLLTKSIIEEKKGIINS